MSISLGGGTYSFVVLPYAWVPCIRYHNDRFYIYYPDPDYGIDMAETTDPAKEWSKPLLILSGRGIIDPAPIRDNNGEAYLAVGLFCTSDPDVRVGGYADFDWFRITR